MAAQVAFKAAAAAATPKPRQQQEPPPSCLSAALLGGGAAGGVASGRLVDCLATSGDSNNVWGSAYLSIALGGCYLAKGAIGLLEPGAAAPGADAWPFSSAPAAPVALILGNFTSSSSSGAAGGAGAGGGGTVRVLTPGGCGRAGARVFCGGCFRRRRNGRSLGWEGTSFSSLNQSIQSPQRQQGPRPC